MVAEQRMLEERWAAEQATRQEMEQAHAAEMCAILKHALDSTGPGQLELLTEATTVFGNSDINTSKEANDLMKEVGAKFTALQDVEAVELAEATAMAEAVAESVAAVEVEAGVAATEAEMTAQQAPHQSCADLSEHKGDDSDGNATRLSTASTAAGECDAEARATAIAAREVRLRKHRVRVGGRIEIDPYQVLYSSASTRVYGGRFNGKRPAVIKRINVVDGPTAETSVEQEVLLELSHSNVIRMFGLPEVDADGNQQYMAFEPCVTGDLLADITNGTGSGTLHPRTLEHVIDHEKLRGIDAVRPIMLQMVEGATYLHGHTELAVHGLTHRDLKPANVLVKRCQGKYGGSNEAKLTDFGSSKIHDEGTMAITQGVGTEGWQAPEVIRGEPTNAAADVFSMGLLFVYCLTGGQHAFGKVRAKRTRTMGKFAYADDEDEEDEEREESVREADRKMRRSVAALIEEERTVAGGSLAGSNGGKGRSLELAVALIERMLRLRPGERPTMKEVVRDPFFRDAGGESGVGGVGEATSGASGGDGGGETKGENECVVCLDNEKTHMFKPCNHLCVCEGCSMAVMGSTAECPACRTEVEGVARVYTT
jgi:serine/threonine protein kinase